MNYKHFRRVLRALWGVCKAIASPGISRQVALSRRLACENCQEKDQVGARLYRRSGAFQTCGLIWWKKPLRDDKKNGCGCLLNVKWRKDGQMCPLGKWS